MSHRGFIGARPALPLVALLSLTLAGACAAAAPSGPAPATPAPAPAIPGDRDDMGGEPIPGSDDAIRDGALIVYTGRLRLEVAEVGPAVDAATRLIVDFGGYVAGSQAENTTTSQSASITFRIPAARWDEALRGLRAQAQRVVTEYTESADVTADVVDLDARITNLRAGEVQLQELMDRASTIDDVLKVQRELSSIRGQIEQLTGQRDYLQRQAAHGTLVVYFETPVAAAAVAQEGWQLGAEVDRAIADLIRIAQRLTSAGIWLGVVVLPVLLPVGLVVYVAYRLRRRFMHGPTSGPTA
jgi:hypothetical protein